MIYKAITPGYLGKELGYINAGQIFDWDGPKGLWMEEVKAEPEANQEPVQLDRKEIIRELDLMNLSYFKGSTTEQLQAQLDNALRAAGRGA
jgi:hypothetical protein